MISLAKQSPLFFNMGDDDIQKCLTDSGSEVVSYAKDEIIFYQEDKPQKLHILLEGTVVIGTDSASGKRSIIATFSHPGELFGEVFLFLDKKEYDNYAQAVNDVKILEIPKDFLYHPSEKNDDYHRKLISNMLEILAKKAYYLNQKIQIMSAMTIRQKLAKVLLQNSNHEGKVFLKMNREELADFLNVARPSVSRELMKMQEDELLKLDGKAIFLPNKKKLQDIL
ncbi:Crp/Fnr family transcriptional regulator [Scatolibacter rhodanostii]|uniref:Crp/Fnr family transcriptional regulator n=1 Tax=Scatolibacter rhodanostii TaxID=2014781 RepID=UPI000C071F0D|nr:Crp/Fnr family transcriptional regulator [Scatolibacter rhodanostii]